MKTCTKCGETKPFSAFYKDGNSSDGLRSACKACHSITNAAWRAANYEKERERLAKWAEANPDKRKAATAKYCAANRDKLKAKTAEWRAVNPDKAKASVSKWAAANQEAIRRNEHNYRARKLEAGGRLSRGLADRLFKLQRGKCACGCKQPLGDDYHLDHRMPLVLGGSNTDDNIQLLRAKCNQQKHAKHPIDFMQQRGFLL